MSVRPPPHTPEPDDPHARPLPPHRHQGRSSLVVDAAAGTPKRAWLDALGDDIACLHRGGADVAVVSSGAIALGRRVLNLPAGALKLDDSQAAAAVGQIALARTWAEVLGARGSRPGRSWSRRATPRSAAGTSTPAPRWSGCSGSGPCRSSTRTTPSRRARSAYGDNDRLAARVATMASGRSPDFAAQRRRTASTTAPPVCSIRTGRIAAGRRKSNRPEDRGHGGGRGVGLRRAAACAPRSRPPRSRPRAAPTW